MRLIKFKLLHYILLLHCTCAINRKNIKPVKMAYTLFKTKEGIAQRRDSTPCIIMHGLLGSRINWRAVGMEIQKETDKQVYTVDARNHGESPKTDIHTYFHLAEDINLFMNENQIESAALIGHSMGGRAVMAFALLYPQRVESLSVIDISPYGTSKNMTNMDKIFAVLKDLQFQRGTELREARSILKDKILQSVQVRLNAIHSFILTDKRVADFLAMSLIAPEHKEHFEWKYNLKTIMKDYDEHIAKFPYIPGFYKGPTIFITGNLSDYVNFADEDRIRRMFPDTVFKSIKHAGHWVHVDQPKMFLKVINKFLIKSAKLQ